MSDKSRIGFIGLGLMGHGMAKNLVAKGWPLSVMAHRNRKPVDELVAMGASEVETPAEMAARSDIVFICVTASGQVEEVVAGPDGLLDGAAPGMIVVDTSTADPNSTLMLAEKCAARGVRLADAPLGGTPEGAHAGALSAMVGADEETYAAIEPAIMAWAAKSVRLGPVGTGHKMKLINNFVSMGYGAIYAEALSTAAKVGISPRVFDSVIRGSRMDCGFYQTYMRWVLERDPEAHRFALRNAHKDMRYFVAMENAAGIVNPVGAVVKNAFAQAEAAGHGDDDLPKISDIVAAANGVKLA